MAVKARFYVSKTVRQNFGGRETTTTIELLPVINGDPNTDWSKYTPSGKIELTVTVEPASDWFESHIGQPVEITFSELPPAPELLPEAPSA